MKITSNSRFLYIFDGPGLLCDGRLFVLELNLAHALYCCYSEELSWSSITNNLQCTIKFADMLKPLVGPGCFSYPDMYRQ